MDKKIFENLSKPQLEEGFKKCVSNAKANFNSAEASAGIGNYGQANSLMILSAEELVKSFLFIAKLMNVSFGDIPIKEYFSSHKTKHQTAKSLYHLIKFQNEAFVETVKSFTNNISKYISLNDEGVEFNKDKFMADGILEIERQTIFKRVYADKKQVNQELSWWDNANDMKNAGLYADYRNNWKVPEMITSTEYNQSKNIVSDILSFVSIIELINFDTIGILQNIPKNVTILKNIAPNGIDCDIVTLTEVPMIDGSGIEHQVEYQDFDFLEKNLIGQVSLIDGQLDITDGKGYISVKGMKLLCNWIEENLED